MKTQYDSIKINASFIGAKSRKAMLLVNPRNANGDIYHNVWSTTSWMNNQLGKREIIEWRHATPEYVEFPRNKVTPAMLVETLSTYGVGDTLIKSRLVDNKVQQYIELQQRIDIAIPTWFIKNLKVKFRKVVHKDEPQEFSNSHSHYSIIDDVAKQSHDALILQERPDTDWMVSEQGMREPAIEQWLKDNPEYIGDLSILK